MQILKHANTHKHPDRVTPCARATLRELCLTSSSLYQDRLSAVRTNQYSLAPPFMMPMLLMVSQPFLITWETDGYSRHTERKWAETQPPVAHFTKLTLTSINLYIYRHLPHTYVGLPTQQKWMRQQKRSAKPPTHSSHSLSFFSSALLYFIPSTLQSHIQYDGVQVIYLEPIVNSSLRLNENVERILQSYASIGHLVKGQIHTTGQLPAHYSRLLGWQQGDSKQGEGRGR